MAEACHRYSAMFIKGVKDVCEKNMAEAFKYSLKVSHDVHINKIDGFGDTWTHGHLLDTVEYHLKRW